RRLVEGPRRDGRRTQAAVQVGLSVASIAASGVFTVIDAGLLPEPYQPCRPDQRDMPYLAADFSDRPDIRALESAEILWTVFMLQPGVIAFDMHYTCRPTGFSDFRFVLALDVHRWRTVADAINSRGMFMLAHRNLEGTPEP